MRGWLITMFIVVWLVIGSSFALVLFPLTSKSCLLILLEDMFIRVPGLLHLALLIPRWCLLLLLCFVQRIWETYFSLIRHPLIVVSVPVRSLLNLLSLCMVSRLQLFRVLLLLKLPAVSLIPILPRLTSDKCWMLHIQTP
jgi:hypothetical protein